MWNCPKCGESSEDSFDACWKCGIGRDGTAPSAAAPSTEAVPDLAAQREVDCLRCRCRLQYAGTKRFHEGANWGLLGTLGELFVTQESFDLYRCPKCGKVEFFVGGSEGSASA